MKVDLELVERVASLSRLKLGPEEALVMQHQLSSILDYVDQLARLPDDLPEAWRADTSVTPTRERPDESAVSEAQAVILDQAPQAAEGLFQVPRILD